MPTTHKAETLFTTMCKPHIQLKNNIYDRHHNGDDTILDGPHSISLVEFAGTRQLVGSFTVKMNNEHGQGIVELLIRDPSAHMLMHYLLESQKQLEEAQQKLKDEANVE